jgi:hypothetical protein
MPLEANLRKALAGEMTPKFLGTLNAEGQPNCVPIISITPYEGDTLIFGEFLMNKTRANLLKNNKVGIAVFTGAFQGWSLKGVFTGFETTGDKVEYINNSPLFRYNAYTSVRAAGTIEVEEASAGVGLGKAAFLKAFAHVSTAAPFLKSSSGDRCCMPDQVAEKFRRVSAVRAVTYRDAGGYPKTFPVMACIAAGPNRLLAGDPLWDAFAPGIPEGTAMAVSVISMDPVAYQVKGRYAGKRAGTRVIDLSECYSASPPLVGERLDRAPSPQDP